MRDPRRIPIMLAAIRAAWKKNPDLRLGQLIHNTIDPFHDGYFVEDDFLFKAIQDMYLKDDK